jgi:glyoxylase-like metal-dependent hydrolase (beta-lactamase superfamily II)
MVEQSVPDPVVNIASTQELGRDVVVIPDPGVPMVPNIGVIGGQDAVLVVDTGLGPGSGRRVLEFATDFADGRRLYLTTTHFHPEHAFGAQAFASKATYLINRRQAEDFRERGPGYLQMFLGMGGAVTRELEGTELPKPDEVYETTRDLDLGGRVAELRATGRAHTLGDQVVTVPDEGVMFTGDLAETAQFSIFPWFPPHHVDVSGTGWIKVMRRLVEEHPRVVVPGHGQLGDESRLTDALGYLELLRDESWSRCDAGMPVETAAQEISTLMAERYPDWIGREWIAKGVTCMYAQHDTSAKRAE